MWLDSLLAVVSAAAVFLALPLHPVFPSLLGVGNDACWFKAALLLDPRAHHQLLGVA